MYGLVAASLALAALTVIVLGFHVEGWDREALRAVELLHGPAVTSAMRGITLLGSWVFLLPVTLFAMAALFTLRRPRAALFIGTAVGIANLLQMALKHLFGRPRPAAFPHLERVSTFAYPSGHATVSAALALAVCVLLWRTRWRTTGVVIGASFVLTVSFSRIYLGVHNPSDVLAGWLLSGAWVALLTLVWPWGAHAEATVRDGLKSGPDENDATDGGKR